MSLVGTTVKRVERLPKDLAVNEKHTWLLGGKIYLPTVVGGGVFLEVSVTNKADAADLEAGYGEFKTEALELDAAYEPHTVNTDGWEATQVAWKWLFPAATLILCFVHSILAVRGRGRSWPDCQILIHHLWKAYREKTEARFQAALSRIPVSFTLAAKFTYCLLQGRQTSKTQNPVEAAFGSLVFPVETGEISKTDIDSKRLIGSDFHQNADFHGKYQRA